MANHQCEKGQVLKCGIIRSGCRSYIGVKGGFDVPEYLGSQATFTLGQFGGHAGRNLLIGDMLPITEYSAQSTTALAQAQILVLPKTGKLQSCMAHMARQIFHQTRY